LRLTIKERKNLDRAYDIIAKSFTYGAKLQRDPISEKQL
jgi:hypothetical protein